MIELKNRHKAVPDGGERDEILRRLTLAQWRELWWAEAAWYDGETNELVMLFPEGRMYRGPLGSTSELIGEALERCEPCCLDDASDRKRVLKEILKALKRS